MSDEEIILEIIQRFRLDRKSLTHLYDYEYELIFHSMIDINKLNIIRAINRYVAGEIKVKVVRVSFLK